MMEDYDGAQRSPGPLEYRRRESERDAYTEKKIGNEWLAYWTTQELPPDANVTHVTTIPYRRDRVVLPYKDGRFHLPETDVAEGESAEDAIRRIVMEQCGIQDPQITHLGHFVYKATTQNTTRPAGTIEHRALYVLEVGSLADFPGDESFERRIALQRDLNRLIRESYIEQRREYTDILDEWLIERLKAEQTGSSS